MISIITPSFNMKQWLELCIASVADQRHVDVEHIVCDGGSRDGTVDWLRKLTNTSSDQNHGKCLKEQQGHRYTFHWESAPDKGMYDAVNKGFSAASGEILAYLNCDEQYLPNALSRVVQTYERQQDTGLLHGDTLITRPDGSLLSFRKTYPLRLCYLQSSHLYTLSCALFFRRKIWDAGFKFDTRLRDLGDMDYVMRILKAGFQSRRIPQFLSTFTMTGSNMSSGKNAKEEFARMRRSNPAWIRLLRPALNILRLTEKLASNAYSCKTPLEYDIYANGNTSTRQHFAAEKPSFRWKTT